MSVLLLNVCSLSKIVCVYVCVCVCVREREREREREVGEGGREGGRFCFTNICNNDVIIIPK